MSARSDTQALRKRMLVARATLERVEIAEQVANVREAVTTPRFFGASLGKLASAGGVSGFVALLRRYPILSTGASLVLAQLRKRLGDGSLVKLGGFGHPLRTAVTAATLAMLGWQAWRAWRRHRPPHDEDLR